MVAMVCDKVKVNVLAVHVHVLPTNSKLFLMQFLLWLITLCNESLSIVIYLRTLSEQYPQLPAEKDFTHNLLSSADISLQKQGGELSILTQFVLERPKLQAGEHLLPDLVEFYHWLHTQLAYIVSYDMAKELKIGQVVERVVERYSKDFRKHVKDLYERVKG